MKKGKGDTQNPTLFATHTELESGEKMHWSIVWWVSLISAKIKCSNQVLRRYKGIQGIQGTASCIWGLTCTGFLAPLTRHWRTGSFVLWSSISVENTWLKIYNELLFPTKIPLYSLTHGHCCNTWLQHTRGIGICWHRGKSFQPSLLHKTNDFLGCRLQKVKKRYYHHCYRLSKYLDHVRGVTHKPTSSLLTIRSPCCQEFPRLFWQQKFLGFRPCYWHLWLQSSILG